MLTALKTGWREYPRQFWLMFFGMLVSTIGSSMIWPFLMVYVSGKLDQPLSVAATLLTINSGVGLFMNFISGPLTDKLGRKWILVIALLGNAVVYLLQNQAATFAAFAIALSLSGAFNPMYRVASDAMLADLIPQEKRVNAYSLIRMSNNLGVALGPTIGGFVAAQSYSTAFYLAALGMFAYGLLLAFGAKETLPTRTEVDVPRSKSPGLAGYSVIFKDGKFLTTIGAFTFCMAGSATLWILLSVYLKTNFGIPENLYGFIPATNAIMVVLFQLAVTRFTSRFNPILVMAAGALFYAVGVGSVYFGQGFWAFWLSMVIITIGELVLVPTTTTFVANLAPSDMRGRYMSIYNLSSGTAMGTGPVIGGFLSDTLGPRSTWIGGFLIGIVSPIMYLFLARSQKKEPALAQAIEE
jgi:MFS family permease